VPVGEARQVLEGVVVPEKRLGSTALHLLRQQKLESSKSDMNLSSFKSPGKQQVQQHYSSPNRRFIVK
jgi:hypothetical protein